MFETRSGVLTAYEDGEQIVLDFPAEPVVECIIPDHVIDSLGVSCIFTSRNRMDYFIEVENENILRGVNPDSKNLAKADIRGTILTCRSEDSKYDFVSRFFAPAFGVDEDPVTGYAHCALGPYWSYKLNKTLLSVYQASKRGGTVKMKISGSRVHLMGQARTVFEGLLKY